jgi:hypothetical protein
MANVNYVVASLAAMSALGGRGVRRGLCTDKEFGQVLAVECFKVDQHNAVLLTA